MPNPVRRFTIKALWALPVWAALLFLGTLTHQPDPQTDIAGFAAYVTTNQFLISHLVASIFGAAIGSIGVIGLMLYLQDTPAAGRAITGMVPAFTLSNFLLPIGQSISSAFLIVATVAIALSPSRQTPG